MHFIIVLSVGSQPIEPSIPSFVPTDNDFRTAAMMATVALFSNTVGADNATAFVVRDGNVATKPFFYAEKD